MKRFYLESSVVRESRFHSIQVATLTLTAILLALTTAASDKESDMFEGVVLLRDGNSVCFDLLAMEEGDRERFVDYYIDGTLDGVASKVHFSEVEEIVFQDNGVRYYSGGDEKSDRGVVIITRCDGKRFTLTNAAVSNATVKPSYNEICYRYSDPVTRKPKFSKVLPKNVACIRIGPTHGDFRVNPRTMEVFSPSYNFDPFTGEKLIWQTKKNR